jgi:hypothetical protein
VQYNYWLAHKMKKDAYDIRPFRSRNCNCNTQYVVQIVHYFCTICQMILNLVKSHMKSVLRQYTWLNRCELIAVTPSSKLPQGHFRTAYAGAEFLQPASFSHP